MRIVTSRCLLILGVLLGALVVGSPGAWAEGGGSALEGACGVQSDEFHAE